MSTYKWHINIFVNAQPSLPIRFLPLPPGHMSHTRCILAYTYTYLTSHGMPTLQNNHKLVFHEMAPIFIKISFSQQEPPHTRGRLCSPTDQSNLLFALIGYNNFVLISELVTQPGGHIQKIHTRCLFLIWLINMFKVFSIFFFDILCLPLVEKKKISWNTGWQWKLSGASTKFI